MTGAYGLVPRWQNAIAKLDSVPCPVCGELVTVEETARHEHVAECERLAQTKLLPPMTQGEARACIEAIIGHLRTARARILELYEREGWKALGYLSWRECVSAEFGQSQSYLYRQLAAAFVERVISPMGEIGVMPERQAREYGGLEPDEQKALAALSKAVLGDKPTAAGIRDLKELSQSLLASGAITVDGQSVGLSEVLEYSLTEEQHERHLRRKQHIADAIEARLADEQARLAAAQTPAPAGKYRCIVIDPPWHIKKIDRDVRPNQGQFLDYPTMTLDQIRALPVPDLAHIDGCHLYLWTTQKYLPDALALLVSWEFHYQCLMTWVKPSGFTPYSWMYNTEHVIFARRGNLPLLQNGLKLSIEAPTSGHSVKPDAFFERVLQASPEPRLEMFARQSHDGFKAWGNEVLA